MLEAVGDAVCAAFARPTDAVAAALAAQLALRREDWAAAGLPAPLRARMGLHTGEGAPAAGGAAPDHCARLAREAHPGQVLLSEATATLVRAALPAGAALRDLGAHRLEGEWPAERLHQLVPPQITGTFPALRGAAGRPHNLPRPLTGLVGREREAADVQRLLAENPLVTLAGPGGAGKTRLALRVAADVLADAAGQAGLPAGTLRPLPDGRDGVWFVDLAPLADGALVPQAVAAAVGVREVPGQPLAGVLAGALRERALLLVLDNCEHLLDACALLVEALLRAGPRLRVLATSREPLRAAGEAVYRVPPLAVPAAPPATAPADAPQAPAVPELVASYPAVRLFVERARAVRPDFAVTPENAAAVAHICRQLDGLPLAIELAAARVRVLTPQQMAARLEDRLTLLTGGARTAGWRQQTLRATLDWSHSLLSPPEQALLRRLSVFAGGWTLEAAEAVGASRRPRRRRRPGPPHLPGGQVPGGGGGVGRGPLPPAGDGAPVRRRAPGAERRRRGRGRRVGAATFEYPRTDAPRVLARPGTRARTRRKGRRTPSAPATPATTSTWPSGRRRSCWGRSRPAGTASWRRSTTTCARRWRGTCSGRTPRRPCASPPP